MSEDILNKEDLFKMLDSLLREPASFWDGFYKDRTKDIPFFHNVPDENLVSYFEKGLLTPGKVLELGCGPGRNALYLADSGCNVEAADVSEEALEWAKERARKEQKNIHFIHKNIFELDLINESYDLIYDSGCFHHLAPHRRLTYVELLNKWLKPGGHFGLVCFSPGGDFGGSELSDWEVYRSRSLMGGMGYTEEKLMKIFNGFTLVEIRKMKVMEENERCFGLPGFQTTLFRKA